MSEGLADNWQAFDIPDEAYAESADGRGQKVLNISRRRPKSERKVTRARQGGDQAVTWLRSAIGGLGILAAAAAAVSYAAQFVFVDAAKRLAWAAALEAGIPDAGSMVFACLGIALALKGKRAIRARALNVACVGLSLAMNALAAQSGWRDMAVWVMPSAVYALASDTLIGVIRAYVLARQGRADDGRTVLNVFGALLLWALRLTLAPPSTLRGFRTWVVESCPVAPGRTAAAVPPDVAALPAAPETPGSAAISTAEPEPPAQVRDTGRSPAGPRGGSKRSQLIRAYEALQGTDPRFGVRSKASEVARELAPGAGLAWGSARSYLYRYLDAEASS